jgi:drug/metabolite transporter (DMT)-like permease
MSRRGWILFAAMCVIWGIPYLLIKVAVEELHPATLVLARTAIGGLILVPIALATGQFRGLGTVKWPLLLYTLIEICGPFVLLGYAETRLSSSLTGLLVAAVPLVGAVIARFSGERERLGPWRVSGLLLGVAGVAALVGLDLGATQVPALLAMVGVALGYAIGPVILTRRLADQPGLGVVAASLMIAAVVYVPVGAWQAPRQWPSAEVVAAVVALAVVCTALAFLIFFRLIAEVGPARATVITYVNPAVALLLGVVILDEDLTLGTGIGFVLVLVGSVLATSGGRGAAEEQPAEAAEAGGQPPVPAGVGDEAGSCRKLGAAAVPEP